MPINADELIARVKSAAGDNLDLRRHIRARLAELRGEHQGPALEVRIDLGAAPGERVRVGRKGE